MINSHRYYALICVLKAFLSKMGVTQPQVSPTALENGSRNASVFCLYTPRWKSGYNWLVKPTISLTKIRPTVLIWRPSAGTIFHM